MIKITGMWIADRSRVVFLGLHAALAVCLAGGADVPARANQLDGPVGQGKGPVRTSEPRDARGITSLKFNSNQDWFASGLLVKRGDRVRVRAWGKAKIHAAGLRLADPLGLELGNVERLLPTVAPFQLIAAVGENAEYIPIGRDAEFRAKHDGLLYFRLNQVDPSKNIGDFDIRVSVGESASLNFGIAETRMEIPENPGQVGAGSGDANDKQVVVSASRDWTNTYIQLAVGDQVTIAATGLVALTLGGTQAGPDGTAVKDPGKLIADQPTGALIGVVGVDNNDFFMLGRQATFTSQRAGLLFLGVNEEDIANNSGSFVVRVTVVRAAKAPGSDR